MILTRSTFVTVLTKFLILLNIRLLVYVSAFLDMYGLHTCIYCIDYNGCVMYECEPSDVMLTLGGKHCMFNN